MEKHHFGRCSTTPPPFAYLIWTVHKNLAQTVNNERIQEMLVLLKETSNLRQPILQIKSIVEETKAEIEETKHTVQNIFKSIQGSSISSMY